MAKDKDVARTYAESLFRIADLDDGTDVLEDELFEIEKRITSNEELRGFLSDTSLPNEEKKKALGEMLAPEASALVRHELDILVDAGRAALIPDVAKQFIAYVEENKNRVLAETTSAIPLTQEMTDRLIVALEKATNKQVTVKNTVDGAIMGGLIIRIEDKIIDLSLRRKLNDMGASLRAGLN